ncbi:MAG: hypothetical protein HOP13_06440 [Alphaproteobacteria bacterium]|nr:hypothetical protein [Alphaproteobacteria bacterium]
MKRGQLLARACALTLTGMVVSIVPANGSPKDSTLDAQIEHGVSGCESAPSDKTTFGFIPPGFDYRFTSTTGAVDARPVPETHLRFAGYWEKSFRRSVISGAEINELKRALRLVGSKASAWLLASESRIDEFLKEYKRGKPVNYEVALLGCLGSAGSVDAIMALKEFEIEGE